MSVPILPDSASTFAPSVDALFWVLVAFSVGLGSLLTFLVLRYAIKYRRGSPASRTGRRARSMPLEIAWTGATIAVAFALFGWGAALYMQRTAPPADALRIIGVGQQWMWKFQYPGGQREIDSLHIPVGTPVMVELASQDVIHSLFIPAFRVKQDAVPGRSTDVWFQATKPGTYQLFCSEFCGTSHSRMTGDVVAMMPEDYAAWLAEQPEGNDLVAQGEALFRALGCSGCHENGNVRAPDLHNVYGHPVALSDMTTVIADDRYIRDSILLPEKEIAAGYDPIMPSFAGYLGEDDLGDLVAYIRSLSDAAGGKSP